MNKTAGVLMVIAGIAIASVAALFLIVSDVSFAGGVLGFGILLIVLVLPLVLGGFYVAVLGKKEEAQNRRAEDMRMILSMIETGGQVEVSDIAIELNTDVQYIKELIYDIVGLGVFNGYINWDDGVLYSMEARSLQDLSECKNCGGNLEVSGKGVFQCPYCGTEYFS